MSSCTSSMFGCTSCPTVPHLCMTVPHLHVRAEDAGTVSVVSPSQSYLCLYLFSWLNYVFPALAAIMQQKKIPYVSFMKKLLQC